MVVAAALTVAIVLAITGATVINALSVKSNTSGPPRFLESIDIMKMMERVKDLREERYDSI